MQFTPRIASLADLTAVQNVVIDAYTPYVSSIGCKPGPLLDDYEALIRAGRVTVVDVNGAIKGILVLIPEEDAMLLDNVAVAASAQGLGLGRELIAYAEKSAKDVGFPVIRLYTHVAMTRNIEYYARIGYVETHRAEQNGLKRVFMAKSLT
ncbi:acyl-CoA N-acyltransferase [Xylaria bambusicola]|uniref:acyl-CoA N-acyltransferase n=1 Tax=Xylaria bambusicola TaxID=326684 RepID=UPI0020087D35|nr:acyl-CoA N-acyltransferase [Xylaria bambusicola]KAI0509533.1 acyl-CoA N-acyltransferase [Xylaria bambusicola]